MSNKLVYSENKDYSVGVSRYNVLRKITDTETNTTYLETQNQKVIPSGNGDFTHIVTVGEENRLDIIANKYYNDASLWWAIAMANNIIDPFVIPRGKSLRIPSISTLNLQSNGILNR